MARRGRIATCKGTSDLRCPRFSQQNVCQFEMPKRRHRGSVVAHALKLHPHAIPSTNVARSIETSDMIIRTYRGVEPMRMSAMLRTIHLIGLVAMAIGGALLPAKAGQATLNIVLVLDGLRPDAITPEETPNLWRLRQEGV